MKHCLPRRLCSSFQLLAPSISLPIPHHPSDFRRQKTQPPTPSPQLQTLTHSIASPYPAPPPTSYEISPNTNGATPRLLTANTIPVKRDVRTAATHSLPSATARHAEGSAIRCHGWLARLPGHRCTSDLTSQRRSNTFHRCGERVAAGRIGLERHRAPCGDGVEEERAGRQYASSPPPSAGTVCVVKTHRDAGWEEWVEGSPSMVLRSGN